MNVAEMLAHALVQGLASALPLSPSGHQLVLRIWLGSPRQLAALSMVAEIGQKVVDRLMLSVSRIFFIVEQNGGYFRTRDTS